MRTYRQEFKSWHGFLRAIDTLDPAHAQLEAEIGPFLAEVEQTPMTRAFKMVILEAFVQHGGLQAPVPLDALVTAFRDYFADSAHRQRDLGPEVLPLEQVSAERLRAYVLNNPIAAWTNPGKRERRPFFALQDNALHYVGPQASDAALFQAAVLTRVAWRLASYFERRYENRHIFNVIHNASDKAVIQLGDGPTALPQGWVRVRVNQQLRWAKVAKIAINVLKTDPADGPAPPNELTAVLEGWFGPGGFRSAQRNRVAITPAEEAGLWEIAPLKTAP